MSDEPITFRTVNYSCPKHGDVDRAFMSIAVEGKSLGKWCLKCWAEMMDKHCERVTEIKEERDE